MSGNEEGKRVYAIRHVESLKIIVSNGVTNRKLDRLKLLPYAKLFFPGPDLIFSSSELGLNEFLSESRRDDSEKWKT